MNPAVDVAIAAVKAAAAASTPKGRAGDQTPAPPVKQPVSSGSGPKEVPALTPDQVEQAEQERVAAMLLGLDDDDVPGGTTVVDVPSIDNKGEGSETVAEGAAKPDQKRPESNEENTSSAASELLRKYMRRPR
jgi:hypothetical protein